MSSGLQGFLFQHVGMKGAVDHKAEITTSVSLILDLNHTALNRCLLQRTVALWSINKNDTMSHTGNKISFGTCQVGLNRKGWRVLQAPCSCAAAGAGPSVLSL